MRRFTTLVFDIGNVLSHFSFDPLAKEALAFTDLPFGEVRDVFIRWSEPFCLGDLDPDSFAERCLEDLQFRGSRDDLRKVYNAGFSPNEVMRPVIERRRESHRLLYLSDTNVWHLDHLLDHDPLLRHFEGGTASFEARVLKPDAAIYEHAAREHGFSPSEAIFVDDRSGNVAGAEAVGFTGLHYVSDEHGSFEASLSALLDGCTSERVLE